MVNKRGHKTKCNLKQITPKSTEYTLKTSNRVVFIMIKRMEGILASDS